MFNTDALLEYLNLPERINRIVVAIILVGAINAIFITYSLTTTYAMIKKDIKKLKIQKAKIYKLSSKK